MPDTAVSNSHTSEEHAPAPARARDVDTLSSPHTPASPALSLEADETQAESLHSSVVIEMCSLFDCQVRALRRDAQQLLLLEAMVRMFFKNIELLRDVQEILVKRHDRPLPVCTRSEELAFIDSYRLPATQHLNSKLLVPLSEFKVDFPVVFAVLRRRGKLAQDKFKLHVTRKTRALKQEPGCSPAKRPRPVDDAPVADADVIVIDDD